MTLRPKSLFIESNSNLQIYSRENSKLKNLQKGPLTKSQGGGRLVSAAEPEAIGADDSIETLDGCNVEIIDETPDEELPPTEGGIA
jgi:hypothetical protein